MDEFFVTAVRVGMPVVLVVVFVVAPILVIRAIRRKPEDKSQKIYADIGISKSPGPGLVELKYHTYDGFLVWFVQSEHHAYLPPQEAVRLLNRLLSYNLTWGLLAGYGIALVPLVAIPNYLIQRRSIKRQARSFNQATDNRVPSK